MKFPAVGYQFATLLLMTSSFAHAQGYSLERAVEQQAMAQARGAQRVAPMVQSAEPKTDWTVVLEQGKCYWFTGGSAAGVRRLSLYLWGPDGRRVTDAKPQSPWATMVYCPPYSGPYHVQAKIDGSGYYMVGQYARAVANTVPPPSPVVVAPSVVVSPQGFAVYPSGSRPAVAVYPPAAYAPGWGAAAAVAPGAPPPQCRMGSDGMNTCGYNCRMGSNGHMYCSGVPNGQCALNSDGTFTCPGAPAQAGYGWTAPSRSPAPRSFGDDKGGRYDYCKSSLDCGFGLFCRDNSCE